jgi:hypothetical protein
MKWIAGSIISNDFFFCEYHKQWLTSHT